MQKVTNGIEMYIIMNYNKCIEEDDILVRYTYFLLIGEGGSQ